MKNVLLLFILIPLAVQAQLYEVDPTSLAGTQFNTEINAIKIDGEGRAIVGGDFTSFDGTAVSYLIRLDSDGNIENGYGAPLVVGAPSGPQLSSSVTDIAVHSDNAVTLVTAGSLARFNSSGSKILLGLSISAWSPNLVSAVAAESSGYGVVVGGNFTDIGNRIAKLDQNLIHDVSFENNIGSGFNDRVRTIKILSTGKILVGGDFTSFNGVARNKVAILNADGTLDTSFDPSSVLSTDVYAVAFQDDGKVLVGSSSPSTRLIRLNIDGTEDLAFDGIVAPPFSLIRDIHTSGTDDIIVAGWFSQGIAKLDYIDGSLIDIAAGNGVEGTTPEVNSMGVLDDGTIVIGGIFSSYNGFGINNYSRLTNCHITIEDDPDDNSVCAGDTFSFSVTATGGQTYQWQVNTDFNGNGVYEDIVDDEYYTGSNTSNLTVFANTFDLTYNWYRCVITDSDGSGEPDCFVTSEPAFLEVNTPQTLIEGPSSIAVCKGSNASFSISYSGTNGGLQWQEDPGTGVFADLIQGGNYSGVNNSELNINEVTQEMDGYKYRLVSTLCSNGYITEEATLTVNEIPVITETGQQRLNICVVGDASFTVDATGTGLTYQWQYRPLGAPNGSFTDLPNGGEVSGATTATLNLTGVDNMFDKVYNNSGSSVYAQFRCRVSSNGCDAFTSDLRFLTIHPEPTFETQPTAPETLCDNGTGVSTSFTAIASLGVNTYQWQVNDGSGFVNVVDDDVYSGANSSTLSLTGANSDFDGFVYRCSIESCPSNIYSDEVILSIGDSPVITIHPLDVTVCEGGEASFDVEATGSGLTYQWQQLQNGSFEDIFDGGVFSGTASTMLQVSNVDGLHNARFRCVVSSGHCSVNSTNRRILVTNEPFFTSSPIDRTICENEDAVFSRAASNFNFSVNSYQWQEAMSGSDIFVDIVDGAKYSGATSTVLTVLSAGSNMSGNRYRLKVLGCVADIVSNPADLTVIADPIISESPIPQTVCDGDLIRLNADAIGTNLRYQWFVDQGSGVFQAVSNASDIGELSFNAEISQSGWLYKCRISPVSPCQHKFVETTAIAITINEPPAVVQSISISNFPICVGEDAEATINLSSGTPSVQWQVDDGTGFVDIVDGDAYSGATTLNLQIIGPQVDMTGYLYRGMLAGAGCEVLTPTVQLNVFPTFDQPVIAADETNPEAPILSISNLPSDFDQITGLVDWYRNGEYFTTSPTLVPTQSGSYTAVLNENGLTVVCQSVPSEPYVFEAVLSVVDKQFYFYPNPAQDVLKIDIAEPLQVRIFSISGKLEMRGRISQNQDLNIQSLDPGQYIVQLLDQNGLIHSEKILKAN